MHSLLVQRHLSHLLFHPMSKEGEGCLFAASSRLSTESALSITPLSASSAEGDSTCLRLLPGTILGEPPLTSIFLTFSGKGNSTTLPCRFLDSVEDCVVNIFFICTSLSFSWGCASDARSAASCCSRSALSSTPGRPRPLLLFLGLCLCSSLCSHPPPSFPICLLLLHTRPLLILFFCQLLGHSYVFVQPLSQGGHIRHVLLLLFGRIGLFFFLFVHVMQQFSSQVSGTHQRPLFSSCQRLTKWPLSWWDGNKTNLAFFLNK